LSLVVINEVRKIFDRMPSFRHSFDELRQLKQLNSPLLATSATLTSDSEEVRMFQEQYIYEDNCINIIHSMHYNLRQEVQKEKKYSASEMT